MDRDIESLQNNQTEQMFTCEGLLYRLQYSKFIVYIFLIQKKSALLNKYINNDIKKVYDIEEDEDVERYWFLILQKLT